jgi:hypothetical protein
LTEIVGPDGRSENLMHTLHQLASESRTELTDFLLGKSTSVEFPRFRKLVAVLQEKFCFGDPLGFEEIMKAQREFWCTVTRFWFPKTFKLPHEGFWIAYQDVHAHMCACMRNPRECREDHMLKVVMFCSCLVQATEPAIRH